MKRSPVPLSPCLVLLAGVLFLVFPGCGGGSGSDGAAPPPAPPPALALSGFATGLSLPIGLEAPDDGTGRLFVIEQRGTIRIIQAGSVLPSAFLDVTALVVSGGEEGLLGLAFHPNFGVNRRFFVHYTRQVGVQHQSVISEYASSAVDPNLADAASERILLVVDQPFDNHNGGQLAFGPDGYLYIALGDGGGGGDPFGNGQSLLTLLGKILRIDVDGTPAAGLQYAIPADNPFAAGGGRPEIWAYGLRNPWRFSFDHPTGRLFAGDVGQGDWEEVSLITRGGNFGWNIAEGNHCFFPATGCDMAGLTAPIAEYDHVTGGAAVIGGFVYRGSSIPGLAGTYVFGDLSSGRVWGLWQGPGNAWQQTLLLTHALTVSAFGRDTAGELYLVDYGNGAVLRLRLGP
jgi:glucose/arabinose dehydrogenase